MQAGKLTERVRIQRLDMGQGRSGGMKRTWLDLVPYDLPASRRDYSGSEKSATARAGGEVAIARTEFTIRWMPGVDATMRVVHDGQFHNIRHVNNFAGRRESLVLTCDTGGNDG